MATNIKYNTCMTIKEQMYCGVHQNPSTVRTAKTGVLGLWQYTQKKHD